MVDKTPDVHRAPVRDGALRGLAALHARGFHAAILAGLMTMPVVAFVGFWTERGDHPPAAEANLSLRGTLDAGQSPAARANGRS